MHLFVPYGKKIDTVWTPGDCARRDFDLVSIREVFPVWALPHLVLVDSVEKAIICTADKNVQAAFLPRGDCGRADNFNTNIFCLPIAPGHDILLSYSINR